MNKVFDDRFAQEVAYPRRYSPDFGATPPHPDRIAAGSHLRIQISGRRSCTAERISPFSRLLRLFENASGRGSRDLPLLLIHVRRYIPAAGGCSKWRSSGSMRKMVAPLSACINAHEGAMNVVCDKNTFFLRQFARHRQHHAICSPQKPDHKSPSASHHRQAKLCRKSGLSALHRMRLPTRMWSTCRSINMYLSCFRSRSTSAHHPARKPQSLRLSRSLPARTPLFSVPPVPNPVTQ